MFGSLGGSELLLIMVLALLLFGPRRLPQIGRTIGRGMAEFRKATNELKANLEQEVKADEIREVRSGIESLNRDIKDTVDTVHPRRIIERVVSGSDEKPPSATADAPESPASKGNDEAAFPPAPGSDAEDSRQS